MKLPLAELGTINASSQQPKFLQIAERIRELIDSGKLELGDKIPSINEIITHFSVSRDTAVKAYKELKNLDIIESTPSKACFVSNVILKDDLKRILFLVDAMTPYKEQLYFGLIDTLPQGFYVDIVTHGDDFEILKSIYEKYKSMRNCAALLIIPTAGQSRDFEYFKFINPGNIFFLDRKIPGTKHPGAWQDFGKGIFSALIQHKKVILKYTRIVFFTKYFTNPIIEEMKESFLKVASSLKMDFIHSKNPFNRREERDSIQTQKGDLFFILEDHLLNATLNECKKNNLTPGKDIGVVSINDGPLYEHMHIPISVLTTNFYTMGTQAATYILTGTVPTQPIETELIIRKSL